MNHVKSHKGQPHRFVLWELVPEWYKTFTPDHVDQVETINSTILKKNRFRLVQ